MNPALPEGRNTAGRSVEKEHTMSNLFRIAARRTKEGPAEAGPVGVTTRGRLRRAARQAVLGKFDWGFKARDSGLLIRLLSRRLYG